MAGKLPPTAGTDDGSVQLGVQAITQTEMAVSHISEESRVIPASVS